MKEEFLHILQDAKNFLGKDYDVSDSFFFLSKLPSEKKSVRSEAIKPLVSLAPQKLEPQKKESSPAALNISENIEKKETAPPVEKNIPQQPLALHVSENMEDLFTLFSNLKLLKVTKEIPDDALAKDIAHTWKHASKNAPVFLLYLKGDPKEETFLNNLAQAISLRLMPAAVLEASKIEKENKWEYFLTSSHLKWIFCTPKMLSSLKELKTHYRQLPATKEHFLNKTPLLFLEPFSSYATSAALKRQLWDNLCQLLKK